MAATLCYSIRVFSLNKLKHRFLFRDHITRFCTVFSLSGHFRRPRFCNCPKTYHQTSVTQLGVKRRRQQVRTFFQSTSDTIIEEEKEEVISRATLMWRAIKLPLYSIALVPLTELWDRPVYLQTGLFSAWCFVVLLASSFLIITWLNLRSR